MRLGLPLAAVLSAFFLASATPAWAGYGALAHDQTSGKFGLSWDKQTQKEADDAAMKDCAQSDCKIVFRTHSRQCGAIASAEKGNAWGASYRGARGAAALAAMNDCQKRTSGQCKVRAAGCNR
jgi:transcription elongation factor